MSVKEIASLAGGGMGIRFITQCVSSVLLSATNVFVGNTIGIEPMRRYVYCPKDNTKKHIDVVSEK